jgi:hypothetical protein
MPHRALLSARSPAWSKALLRTWAAMACLLGCAAGGPASAAPLYLCKSFAGGGQFWSASHCSKTNALVEKVVSVPDGLGFDQQVAAAERSVAQPPAAPAAPATPAARYAAPGATPALNAASAAARHAPLAECGALAAQLKQLDIELRSATGPEKQKPLVDRKHKVLERRFELRCR